ncbi:UDP-sugar transporter protein SLC35A5-like [Glandiceps talaboti]
MDFFAKKRQALQECISDRAVWITILLGSLYVCLGTSRILLIRVSANEDHLFEYLPVTVNVCAELVKLIICSTLAIRLMVKEGKSCKEMFYIPKKDVPALFKWAVPGILYFLDNLINFYTIMAFGPAVAVLLSNFVVITTSILFRLILRRKFSSVQWAAVVILFLSLVALSTENSNQNHVNQHKDHAIDHIVVSTVSPNTIHNDDMCRPRKTHSVKNKDNEETTQKFKFTHGHLLVLTQCLIASTANIYNEKIFKEGKGMEDSIYVQNSKLYIFGVIFNSLSLIIHQEYRNRIYECGFFYGYNIYAMILILTNSCFGLTIATILKFRDNMFHVMSSSTVTVVVITYSIAFLHFEPSLNFFLQAPVVLLAIFVYNASKLTFPEKESAESSQTQTQLKRNGRIHSEQRNLISAIEEEEEEEDSV